LSFANGLLFRRMELLIDYRHAHSLWDLDNPDFTGTNLGSREAKLTAGGSGHGRRLVRQRDIDLATAAFL
jgi:hypothetical protein